MLSWKNSLLGLRRYFALPIFAALLALSIQSPVSASELGIRALDEAAVTLKTPGKVPLIAITRIGGRLVAVGVHGAIVYSDDNGASWKQAKVPVSATLVAVSFASAADGWAVGHYGVILHTGDGGLTWQTQLNGLQANKLTMDAAEAAVAGNDPAPGTPFALKRAKLFTAAGADKPFLALWTPTPDDVIAFGSYRLAMKSTDGGHSWTDWSLHIADEYSQNLYDLESVGADLYIAAEAGFVFRSTDAGASFQPITKPAAATMLGVIGTGDGGGILVFGVAGQAFRSDDSGQTWQSVTFGTDGNLVAACALRSGQLVVAGEDGTLYMSRDHGRSFNALPEVQPMALYGLSQAADGDIIAVGSGGALTVPASDLQ